MNALQAFKYHKNTALPLELPRFMNNREIVKAQGCAQFSRSLLCHRANSQYPRPVLMHPQQAEPSPPPDVHWQQLDAAGYCHSIQRTKWNSRSKRRISNTARQSSSRFCVRKRVPAHCSRRSTLLPITAEGPFLTLVSGNSQYLEQQLPHHLREGAPPLRYILW